MGRSFKHSILTTITLVIGLVFLEILLQVASGLFPPIHDLLASDSGRTIEDARLRYRPNPHFPEHDERGFRNAEARKQAVIVALGDSMTYGNKVKCQEAWPQQLEVLSQTSVYNMSFGGYGPVESLILLDEALELKPHLVLEAFYVGNDLFDSFEQAYLIEGIPDLRSSDGAVVKALMDAEAAETIRHKFERIWRTTGRMPGPVRGFFSANSKLYAMLRAAKNVFNRRPDRAAPTWDVVKASAQGWEGYVEILEYGPAKTLLTSHERSLGMNQQDPRIKEGKRVSLEAVRRMNERLRAEDIAFIVLFIPTKETVYAELVDESGLAFSKEYANLVEAEEALWREIQAFLTEHDIPYVNMLPKLRRVFEQGQQPYFPSDEGHPNSVGQRAIAVGVYTELQSKGLLPGSDH